MPGEKSVVRKRERPVRRALFRRYGNGAAARIVCRGGVRRGGCHAARRCFRRGGVRGFVADGSLLGERRWHAEHGRFRRGAAASLCTEKRRSRPDRRSGDGGERAIARHKARDIRFLLCWGLFLRRGGFVNKRHHVRREILRRLAQRIVRAGDRLHRLIKASAGPAAFQMGAKLLILFGGDLAVDRRADQLFIVFAVFHASHPFPCLDGKRSEKFPLSRSAAQSFFRARLSRDLTVPTSSESAAAISS